MTPIKQKLILGLGVAMTFAMTQTSDAQLFRFRRSACPQPAVSQSCCQNGAANIAPEVTYEAPQLEVAQQSYIPVEVQSQPVVEYAATALPAVQSYTPIIEQSQPVVETSPQVIDYPILEVPTVFESTPTLTSVSENSEVVVYDSASDIQVTDTQATNVAPAAASEEITLAAPASVVPPVADPTPVPTPAPASAPALTPVPEPVAEGDTEIKKEMSQPVVVPSVTETKAAAVEEVQESILTKQF